MKTNFFLIVAVIVINSCNNELIIDTPNEIKVSKGEFSNKIEIKWKSPIDSKIFEIYRAETIVSNFKLLGKTTNNLFIDSTTTKLLKTYYYKIRVFNSTKEYSEFSKIDSGYISEKYNLIKTFGDFNMPYSIDFDFKNNIYISDPQAGKVKIYDYNGNYISDFISIPGTIIRGIKFLKNGNLLITESNLGKIAFYSKEGSLISEKHIGNTTMLREIAIDDSSDIYAVDMENKQIIKLDSMGNYKTNWKPRCSNFDTFSYPEGLEFCDSLIAVSCSDLNGNIEFYSLEGVFVREIDLVGGMMYISKDTDSNFYLANFDRVIKVSPNGKILATIGLGYLEAAISVNINNLGDIFIIDEKKPKIISVFKMTK